MRMSTEGTKDAHELGGREPLPGRYHAVVKAVDEGVKNLNDCIVVEFETLAGTVPGQNGKVLRSIFGFNPAKAQQYEQLKRWAMIVGLIQPGQVKDVNFQDAIGRQLIIEVEDNEYNGKKRRQIPFFRDGIWAIGYEDVRDVPLEKTMIDLHQKGQVAHVAHSGAKPAAAQPHNADAPVAAGSAWDVL